MVSRRIVYLFVVVCVLKMFPDVGSTECRFENPINMIDFIMNIGTWYLQLKQTVFDDGGISCVEYDLEPKFDEYFHLTKMFKRPGSDLTEMQKFKGNFSRSSVAAKLNIFTPNRTFETIILNTDYDNYAIIYSCMEEYNNTEEFWILTRERNPSEKVMALVEKSLGEHKIDKHMLSPVNQTNCY